MKCTSLEINKKCISPYDDKRYIFDDGIRTLPFSDMETREKMILKKTCEDILNAINKELPICERVEKECVVTKHNIVAEFN